MTSARSARSGRLDQLCRDWPELGPALVLEAGRHVSLGPLATARAEHVDIVAGGDVDGAVALAAGIALLSLNRRTRITLWDLGLPEHPVAANMLATLVRLRQSVDVHSGLPVGDTGKFGTLITTTAVASRYQHLLSGWTEMARFIVTAEPIDGMLTATADTVGAEILTLQPQGLGTSELLGILGYPTGLGQVVSPSINRRLPVWAAGSVKGEHGHVVVVGGSPVYRYPPYLAAQAALATGVDSARVVVPPSAVLPVLEPALHIQVLSSDDLDDHQAAAVGNALCGFGYGDTAHARPGCVLLGPGLGGGLARGLPDFVRHVIGTVAELDAPLVFDGSLPGPEILSAVRPGRVVLTPNRREFARSFGLRPIDDLDVLASEVDKAACATACTIAVTGPVDVIGDGSRVLFNTTGAPHLARNGSGDALSGAVAGFIAQGVPTMDAAALALYHLGRAGERLADRLPTPGELLTEFRSGVAHASRMEPQQP